MIQFILSWRYFTKKRVALAAITAISLIVMMVVIVLNIMSGLVNEVRGKNHIWSGDIILSRSSLVGFDHYSEFMQVLTGTDYIKSVSPVIRSFGISSDNMPVMVYGFDLESYNKVASPGKFLDFPEREYTSFQSDIDSDSENSKNGCFAGQYYGGGNYWPDAEINITFPGIDYRGLPAGPEAGMNQSFTVIDHFKTGMPDVDSCVYADFLQLQNLCWMAGQDSKPPRIHELRIKLNDGEKLNIAVKDVENLWETFLKEKEQAGQANLLTDVKVQSWATFRRANIEPLEHEKNMMALVFCLISIVCTFIILAIFHMIVLEKQKDIGIIKSCGAGRALLAVIYLNFGLIVGLIGTGIGVGLGVAFVSNTVRIEDWMYGRWGFRLWPENMYAIERIPNTVVVSDTIVICITAIIFSVAGALIPAFLAARQKPVDSLRVE